MSREPKEEEDMITESSKYGGNDPTLYCVHSYPIIVLLQATVGADPANYDAYSVFKVFATFPEVSTATYCTHFS